MRDNAKAPRDHATGRAARELRVSPAHVRALCQAGMIAARATPGGHFRIPKSEIERLKRDGVPDPPPATPTESQGQRADALSPENSRRHPALLAEPSEQAIDSADRVVRLENEVKALGLERQKEENLDWFRERHRRHNEAKEVRDREASERRAQRLRREWENECVNHALDSVPEDAPQEFRLPIAKSVRDALGGLDPSDPPEIVEQLVGAAMDRALRPWRHRNETEAAVEEARNQLPAWARSWNRSTPTAWELRAMSAARDVIANLRSDASLTEMQAAAITAGREATLLYEDSERRRAVVDSVSLPTQAQKERASQTVKKALEKLPVGTSRAEMESVRDEILAPAKAADEAARAEIRAASQADFYLVHVDSYLTKIAAHTRSEPDLRDFSNRFQLVRELKQEIRPILIDAILEEPLGLDEAHTFIETLVDRILS